MKTKPIIDLVGKRFERLTVLGMSPKRSAHGKVQWVCECDCGQKLTVPGNALNRGNTRSCGCLKVEKIAALNRTHGASRSPTYTTWCTMKDRCYNPNNKKYADYGGRGITVCDRWIGSYEHFVADMGERPFRGAEIDRKENNGNYEPGNCRWATRSQQTRNKRTTRWITVDGVTKSLAEWSEETGVGQRLIWKRISNGWTAGEAVKTPPLKTWSRKKTP